jgi:hypothetical protein
MIGLLEASFAGVVPDKTLRDIAENDLAILLRDPASGRLGGFSLMFRAEGELDGRKVGGLCSDDTIVDRRYWGTTALLRALLAALLGQAEARPGRDWYWFYACKGYRTYRILPTLFTEHWPQPGAPIPEALLPLAELLTAEYGHARFDPATRLMRYDNDGVYVLRPGVGDIDAHRLAAPHVGFFQSLNPDWQEGVELACLAPVSRANLTPQARRWLAAVEA